MSLCDRSSGQQIVPSIFPTHWKHVHEMTNSRMSNIKSRGIEQRELLCTLHLTWDWSSNLEALDLMQETHHMGLLMTNVEDKSQSWFWQIEMQMFFKCI